MSIGRMLEMGEREVPILNERHKLDTLKINMNVHTVEGFSGHCDRSQLLAFMRNMRPRPSQIITMHGDENKTNELARTAAQMLHVDARSPMNLDTIRLR